MDIVWDILWNVGIPERRGIRTPMSTSDENQIKISSFADVVLELVRVLPEMALLFVEGRADGVLFEELNRARIKWCLSSCWRGYRGFGVRS